MNNLTLEQIKELSAAFSLNENDVITIVNRDFVAASENTKHGYSIVEVSQAIQFLQRGTIQQYHKYNEMNRINVIPPKEYIFKS